MKDYGTRKKLLGLVFGLLLAIIVLNVDKKLWQPLELETINNRNTTSKINKSTLPTEKTVLILFGDRTQFLLRQNGMPIKDFEKRGRGLLKTAIEKLESYGVRSIGINLNLNSPGDPKSDSELTKTISKYKNIVIADSVYSFPFYTSSNILKSARAVGYGELYADYDKIVHKIKLIDKGYKEAPSFSYALYKVSSGNDVDEKLRLKEEFYLKYPKTKIAQYSFIDLLSGEIKKSALENKTVILGIGLNSKLIRNQLLNPFDRNTYASDSYVQAVALTNLYGKSYLIKVNILDYSWLYILLSMIIGLLFSSMSTFKRLILASAFAIVLVASSQVAYTSFQMLFELMPLVYLLFGNLIIGSIIFLQLNLQEQNIELENALRMLSKRSKELEASQGQLQNKNVQLGETLSELRKRVDELKLVRKQLSKRSEEERKRIARELHDDTLARITDLRRYIESQINSNALSLTAKKDLGVTIPTLDSVTSEVRRIINALRPSMLDNALGLIPAIESLLDELSKRSNHRVQVKLTTILSRLKLSETGEINLYRLIQEALNNVYKHSSASKVDILIEEQPGQVLILVSDNGIGFTNTNKKGYGLIDMRERADLIGAKIQYLSRPKGPGTTLEIMIPANKVERVEKSNSMPWHAVTTGII